MAIFCSFLDFLQINLRRGPEGLQAQTKSFRGAINMFSNSHMNIMAIWALLVISGQYTCSAILADFLKIDQNRKSPKLHWEPQEPQNKIFHRLRVQKSSSWAKFFKNKIFVVVRNFYRQQIAKTWTSQMVNLLPIEISDGKKKSPKIWLMEIIFAPSNAIKTQKPAPLVFLEVWAISAKNGQNRPK